MKTKMVVVALITITAGVFTYMRTHNAIPSDLRDAPRSSEVLNSAGLQISDVGAPPTVPVAEAEKGLFGIFRSARRTEADAMFSRLAKQGYSGNHYETSERLFNEGKPAGMENLSGWHAGCRVERKRSSVNNGPLQESISSQAALLAERPVPQLKKKNVVPLVIDVVPDFAGLDYYDNMSPELVAQVSKKVMENKPDSLYYIELPAAMMESMCRDGSLFFRLEYRMARDILVEKVTTSPSYPPYYTLYYKNITPK